MHSKRPAWKKALPPASLPHRFCSHPENREFFHDLVQTHLTRQNKMGFGKGLLVAECTQCNRFTVLSHSRSNLYVAATLDWGYCLRDLQKACQHSLEPVDSQALVVKDPRPKIKIKSLQGKTYTRFRAAAAPQCIWSRQWEPSQMTAGGGMQHRGEL